MQCRPQLEALAAYLTDFIAVIPASTRGVVGQSIQQCLGSVAQEFAFLEGQVKGYQNQSADQKEGPSQSE